MRLLGLLAVLAVAPSHAKTLVERTQGAWRLENAALRVQLDEATGTLQVLDKRNGYLWRPATGPGATETVVIPQATALPTPDGQLDTATTEPSIRLRPDMTADAKEVDDAADLSALVWLRWTPQALYVAAQVRDDKAQFATLADTEWWQGDSAELWVNSSQIALILDPQRPGALLMGKGRVPGAKVAVRPQAGGYVFEAVLPWGEIGLGGEAKAGARFRLAFGLNDADRQKVREGQLYYPRTWVHSDPTTFAQAALADAKGDVPPPPAQGPAAIRSVRMAGDGITFEAMGRATDGREVACNVTLRLPDGAADVAVEVDLADRSQAAPAFTVFDPLVLDAEKGFVIAARYQDGLLVATDDMAFQDRWWTTHGTLDMPWVGLTDLKKGYLLLAETPDNARVQLRQVQVGDRKLLAPALYWEDSKGQFRYPRRFLWSFVDQGGHVAICKRYRAYAKEQGFFKTLREKQQQVPQLERLAGAPDFWGVPGLEFCREAKAAGIRHALINGRWSPQDMQAMVDLGYLVGEYDNYVDIQEGPLGESNRAPLPQSAIYDPQGNPVQGWVTWDKKTTFMKMCPALAKEAAQLEIPPLLKKYPYNARFLDVTTASGLLECYSPQHPLTRTEFRQANEALAQYVKSLGLVLGGEHGRWYGVPYYDYWEGMQSGGFYSWPAGHVGVNIPQKREEIGADYLKYGIGHYNRAPLWELCFHDCVVSTWYWGDSTGHLYNAAPDLADKQDAFNILYGTIPLYWVSQPYSFRWDDPALRQRLLQSYRNTCKLHERLFYDEMLSHEFVTDDHAVQRTTWQSGLTVTVNFGQQPYEVKHAGKPLRLPTNGFLAVGKDFVQYKALDGERAVTHIRSPEYAFCDPGGAQHDFGLLQTAVPVTLESDGEGRLIVHVAGTPAEPIVLRPQQFAKAWDLKSSRLYALDDQGQRVQEAKLEKTAQELVLPAAAGGYQLLSGKAVRLPDLAVLAGETELTADLAPGGRQELRGNIAVANHGLVSAEAQVTVAAQTAEGPVALVEYRQKLAPDEKRLQPVSQLLTSQWAGTYRLTIEVRDSQGREELLANDNVAGRPLALWPDFRSWPLPCRAKIARDGLPEGPVPVSVTIDAADVFAAQGIDPQTIRCVFRASELPVLAGETVPFGEGALMLPCQFEPTEGTRGVLAFLLPPEPTKPWPNVEAGLELSFYALPPGSKLAPAPMGDLNWDDKTQTFESQYYRLTFRDGVISGLWSLAQGASRKSFLSSLGVSSQETGWVDEVGEVESFDVLAKGPVRVVVRVVKNLRGGYHVTKRYELYRDYFVVEADSDKPLSLYCRAYYTQPCTFADDLGNTAKVDGQGDAENVSGKNPSPKWYACYSDAWAHSCIALSEFRGLTYWDAGSWGGIGFGPPASKPARLAYVIHGPQQDATFAQRDYQRLTTPIAVSFTR